MFCYIYIYKRKHNSLTLSPVTHAALESFNEID